MKFSPSAASPSSRKKSPSSLKDRLHLRGVFSKKVKSPPLNDDVISKVKLPEGDEKDQEALLNRSSCIHDDYGHNPAAEESSAQPVEPPKRSRRKSIENPDRGRRSSIPFRDKSTEDKEVVDFSLDNFSLNNAIHNMEDTGDGDDDDDNDEALAEKTKKKDDSDSTLSTEEDDSNAEDLVSRALQIESRIQQASVADKAPTIKKKKKIRPDTEKSSPRKTREESAESTPNGTKKKTKKSRRASVGGVDTIPRTLEDVSLADTKSSKKKKTNRSRSVGAVDTKSRRKSSEPESPQSVRHGTMDLNDLEDEPPMTPGTKARRAVGTDGKVRRLSSKTRIEPLKDEESSQIPPSAHRRRLSIIKPPPFDAKTPSKSPSARRKRLSLDYLSPGKSPSAHERRLSLDYKSPGKSSSAQGRRLSLDYKSPGNVRNEIVRNGSDGNYSDISADTLLNSQASDHTINSEITFGNHEVVHLHKYISHLKSQVETFKEQHQAANVEASMSRSELISMKLEYQKAQVQRRGLRAELRESEAILVDKDRKIATLEKAVESQLDKTDELEERLKKANDEIYQWQDKTLHLEAQIRHGDEGGRSNHRAEEKNIQLDEQRHARLEKRQQELDEQLQQIQRERLHLEGLRRDNDSQRSGEHLQQVESLKQIQAETAQKLSEKDEAIQELQRKLEVAWQLNMDGLEPSVDTAGTDKQASEKKLQEEKHQLSATLEKKDETIAYIQMELSRLKNGLVANGSGDFAALERECDARKAEAQAAKSKYQGAQKRNMLLEDDIDHWKSLNCNLEDDVQAVKAEASEWKAKYEQMRQQAGISDSGSPVRHSPSHSSDYSERRASRRRTSISGDLSGVYNSGVGDAQADLQSSSRSRSASRPIRDSLREMCSTPVQHNNNDGSVREGSLRGIRGMLSSLVSPLPLTNNSSHLRHSNHIPRNTVANNSSHLRHSNHIPRNSFASNSD